MASSAALLGATSRRSHGGHRGGPPRRRSRRIAPAAFLGLGGKAARGDASNASGVTLWGSPGSRSPLVDWYLHELDVPFDAKSPGDPNNPHPFGQIPALRDGDVEVFESGVHLDVHRRLFTGAWTRRRSERTRTSGSCGPTHRWTRCCSSRTSAGRCWTAARGARNRPRRSPGSSPCCRKGSFERRRLRRRADVGWRVTCSSCPIFFADVSFARWPNTARYMGRCVVRPAYSGLFGGGPRRI